MKKTKFTLSFYLCLSLLFTVTFATEAVLAAKTRHEPITIKLKNLLDKNPKLKEMLKTSLAEAKKKNSDKKTNPVQSLSEYYDFIDSSSKLIPQETLNNPDSLTREQILQSICYFYFLVDQPISQLKNKGLFNNTIQYYEPFASWLRDFASTWGSFLGTKNSWNKKTYKEFYKDPRFGLNKDWYESPSNWKTFNHFFSRRLKSPNARPIAAPNDSSVVVSPADSVPQGVWSIDKKSNIQVDGGLKVKFMTHYNVNSLLSKDSKYKDAFANGKLTHTFLNVNDYHRYHFAVGGTVKEKKVIQQNVALEVVWDPKTKKYVPIDSTGWQFSQTRGYVIIDTKKYGLVALIPMGMAQVSSVNFEDNVTIGSTHKKGDMLGTFLFGGSDFVMLFQEKAGFKLTLLEHYKLIDKPSSDHKRKVAVGYQHVLMGEEYGSVANEKAKIRY